MSNQQPDFGVMDQGWAAPETSDADAVKASLETIKVADALGFDSAWSGMRIACVLSTCAAVALRCVDDLEMVTRC